MFTRILLFISIALVVSGFTFLLTQYRSENIISPVINEAKLIIKPLERYSIENLKLETIKPQEFIISDKLIDSESFSSNLFYLKNNESSVSGLINIPAGNNPRGIIILLRGYVDRSIFTSGTGTKRIGEKLATNGFITIAPDFLGYGYSSMPSILPIEERFQTYTTVLSLLNSLPNAINSLKTYKSLISEDLLISNIGLFGHSNGGHIALAILEITGKNYPTALWAPVGKPFPFSILAFTDEYEDKGKALRKLVSDFEMDYDISKYSVDEYFDFINAPIQIHQGLQDVEVPYWWSDELVEILKNKEKEVEYFKYPGEDHNFNSAGLWETMATRTVNFYFKQFNIK